MYGGSGPEVSPAATPVVETERLRLRGHRSNDLEACAAMWGDPDVVRYIGGSPSTKQQTWMRLLNYVGHWNTVGFGYWLVEDKRTRRFVGEVGFADFKRDLDPSFALLPEIGWALRSDARGMGYAREAVGAALAWGDARWARTFCIISPQNVPSLRVASAFDYRETSRVRYHGDDTIVFERSRS